jgi:hypothetical protein
MASFGSAFTGQDDGTEQPTRNIVADSASGIGQALFGDPESRAALLQIGLGLMQPVGLGQTPIGHIGQAIGGGGEAVGRYEKQTQEEEDAAAKREAKQRELDIRQQESTGYLKSLDLKKGTDALALEQLRQQGRQALQGTRDYAGQAKRIWEHTHSITFDPKEADDSVKPFVGMSEAQIEETLRKQYPQSLPGAGAGGGGGGAPAPPVSIEGATRDQGGNRFTNRNGRWVYTGPTPAGE